MTATDTKLLEHLLGTQCACGSVKQTRMSHCRECYYALPEGERRALYHRIGKGYAEAYVISLATLRAKGRVKCS